MKPIAILLLAAIVLPAQAQTQGQPQASSQGQSIYRCGSGSAVAYQDHPCANGKEVQRGGFVQPAPSPGGSAAEHYKAYLDSVAPAAPAASPAPAAATSAPTAPPAQTEAERRAVFICNADQRLDEMHNGYASYSCDPRTGEKKLVERQVIVVDHDGRTRP